MVSICNPCFYKLIVFPNFYCVYTTLTWFSVSREHGFLNNSIARCHDYIMVIVKLFNTNKRLYFFTRITPNKVNNCSSSRSATSLGNVVHLKPVTLSLVGEKKHIVVSVCNEKVFYKILFFTHSTLNSPTSTPLCSIGV